MVTMMVVMLCLYIGANIYLYVRVMTLMSSMPLGLRALFTVLLCAVALSMFLAVGLRNAGMSESIQRAMFVVGSVWMVFLLYMTIFLIVCDIIGLFIPFKGGLFYALLLTVCLLVYGYVNYRTPKPQYIDIADSRFEGDMRIVAISDVHLGYGTTRSDLARYVDIINGEKPDMVLIVGDLIDNSIEPVCSSKMEQELAKIDAPLGVYMAVGNHEYISGIDACKKWLDSTNIVLLRDSVATVAGVNVIGRDDKVNRARKTVAELMQDADGSSPTIVLDHQPYDIAESAASGVLLHISGHTHRGQVFPLNIIVDRMYEQSCGYRMWGNTHAFVSSGLSLWGPPFRIGTNSDYAVIECHKE